MCFLRYTRHQEWCYEYNPIGNVIRSTDPLGRTTVYTYAANGIDLLEVRQVNGQETELLWSGTYNSQHLPLTVTDPSGQTWTNAYNSQGQLLTMTTPARAGINESRTTTYSYDSNGYLQSVTGPAAGATTSFTYDSYGRVRTSTDSDSYTLTYDYDALDRVTRVAYPDGSFEEVTYNRLDTEGKRDRLGHWTRTFHDALRRVVALHDPAGRMTQLQYDGSGCPSCGGGGAKVSALIDPNGKATRWEYDLQGRLTQETWPDSSSAAVTYETTSSRVKQIRDRKEQLIDLEYFPDNKWKRVSFSNTTQPTPSVSFTYDPIYNRLATMADGMGTTSYSFYPVATPPTVGAGRLQTVDGPLGNDPITYGYDELGRVVSRSIDGAGTSFVYDALGRLASQVNSLGTFTYGYDGVSGRVTSVVHPSGRSTSYSYEGNAGDRRLQQIVNQGPGSSALSSFQYVSGRSGMITSWTQQVSSDPAKAYDLERDPADRLTSAILRTTDPTPAVLKRYRYAYDPAGNRTTEQIDDVAVAATHDVLNALTGLQPGGALVFKGALNEPATVIVQGQPATVDAMNAFQGQAGVGSGATNVAVAATDPSGNTRTNTYQVTTTGSAAALSYDANGNLTSDGARTFEWDGANRLTAVNQGSHRSEFSHDGWGHRVRIVEKDSGAVTSDRRFLWCGTTLCEERDASGAGVVRRFFAQGMEDGGTPFFYAMDHLGNVRELTDASGTVRARYDYDPYGRATKLSGDKDSVFTFAGLLSHSATGLMLATFRAYDPGLGRWTSRDPIGLAGGLNSYAYAGGAPVDAVDPLGLLHPGPVYGGALLATGAILTGTGIGTAVGVGIIVIILVTQEGDGSPHDPQGAGGGGEGGAGGGGGTGTGTGTGTNTDTTTGPPPPPPPPPPVEPRPKCECKPCVPPVGTTSYRMDTSGPPHRGVAPPHWHLYVMMQSPYPVCKCFWHPIPDNRGGSGGGDPPPGTSPIGPAAGGGPL
jgi:RHS repeat-associated protein